MTPEMEKSLAEMSKTLDRLYETLDKEIELMEKDGRPPEKINHVRAGSKAIKDCGNMLLVWSDYIARGDIQDRSAENRDEFPR
ncbi:MAG TPA: hypothetical protein VIU33_07155 [Nitrospiria bacterium]